MKKLLASYAKHLKANWIVAVRCIIFSLFRFIHGLIPYKYTEHEYWRLKNETQKQESVCESCERLKLELAAKDKTIKEFTEAWECYTQKILFEAHTDYNEAVAKFAEKYIKK